MWVLLVLVMIDCCLWLIVLVLWFLLLERLCLIGWVVMFAVVFAGLICLLCDVVVWFTQVLVCSFGLRG